MSMPKRPETIGEWKVYLQERLDATQVMVLATGNGESVWICPIYFAYDISFTFFFLSRPFSRHMQNIEMSASVACAIFDPHQSPRGKVCGVQMAGMAHLIDTGEAKHAFDTYFAPSHVRTPVSPNGGPLSYVGPAAEWHLVKVIPENIECFDEEHFDGKWVIPVAVYKAA